MKHVLITGAAGAIGSAMAVEYAAAGYDVTLHCKSGLEKARAMAHRLAERNGVRTLALSADLADPVAAEELLRRASDVMGSVDILVNNAGIARQHLFDTISDAEWSEMLETNLSGVFRMCRAVLPDMLRRHRGSILNISSMWGQVGASCEVDYSAAKAGIIGLTRALAKEVGRSGITVNCIAPGVIRSPMLSSFTQDDLRELCDETPMGRLGEPEDVAHAAVFLTGPGARFITGQVLGVNGGFVIGG